MTKERRLAIKQWEQIVEWCKIDNPAINVDTLKRRFCEKHRLNWQHNCWFCQYVRKDFRPDLKTRSDIAEEENNCYKCPLYKYEKEHRGWADYQDNCGCTSETYALYVRVRQNQDNCGYTGETDTLYERVRQKHDIEAARMILKALKGEYKE